MLEQNSDIECQLSVNFTLKKMIKLVFGICSNHDWFGE